MRSCRGNAIAVGVLLITCPLISILSAAPLGSTLDGRGYLSKLASSDNRVTLTALIELGWAATGAGIAIALHPLIRNHHRALALGSVAARVAEGVLVLLSVSRWLLAKGLSSSAAGAEVERLDQEALVAP